MLKKEEIEKVRESVEKLKHLPPGVREGLFKAILISKGCEDVKDKMVFDNIVLPKKAVCEIIASRELEKGIPIEEIDFERIKKLVEKL